MPRAPKFWELKTEVQYTARGAGVEERSGRGRAPPSPRLHIRKRNASKADLLKRSVRKHRGVAHMVHECGLYGILGDPEL